jgi:hypothetical protein
VVGSKSWMGNIPSIVNPSLYNAPCFKYINTVTFQKYIKRMPICGKPWMRRIPKKNDSEMKVSTLCGHILKVNGFLKFGRF